MLFDKIKKKSITGKMVAINDFVNENIAYTPDKPNEDYWQTPQETLKRKRGDCDDIAILKFFSLLNIGANPKQVSILTCNTDRGRHAATLAYDKILDIPDICKSICQFADRGDIAPIMRLNETDLWLWIDGDWKPYPGRARKIRVWRDCLDRMKTEPKGDD